MTVTVSLREVDHRQTRRSYLLIEPAQPTRRPLPAIVDLHGSGLRPEDHARTADSYALAEDALVLLPFGVLPFQIRPDLPPATSWSVPGAPLPGEEGVRHDAEDVDDVAFIADLAQILHARHGADPDRIHLRGYSAGARLASYVAGVAPDAFASVCCVSGVRTPPGDLPLPPLLALHGLKDPGNPFAGSRTHRWREPVPKAVDAWAQRSAGTASTQTPIAAGVRETRYLTGGGHIAASLIVIDEAEHSWPGTRDLQHVAAFGSAGRFSASAAHAAFIHRIDAARNESGNA